ncbi:hypothetical protein ACUOA8_53470, partial [Escherichia sp. SS-MK2]
DVQQQVKTLEKTTVADTNTEWSKLQATAWMKKGDMVNDIKPIWAYADSLYNGTCNQCHGAPEIAHFDANGWISFTMSPFFIHAVACNLLHSVLVS